jgi:enterochelin esterase-like enzyme
MAAPSRAARMVDGATVIGRSVVALVALALLAPGAHGAYRYLHDYNLYRGFAPPHESAAIQHGQVRTEFFYSPALHQRREYLAYLPPGYDAGVARGVRYPVLYLLHAPVGQARNYGLAGDLYVRIDELLHRHRIRPFITVLPMGHGADHEWANARDGRYQDFVVDVVHSADQQFSTLRNRRARMLAGLSAGGYGAVNIALHQPNTFGSFESWSGYYVQTPTDAFAGTSKQLLHDNSPAEYLSSIAPTIRRLPFDAFLYQGTGDDVSAPAMFSFARQLRSVGVRTQAAVYPGRHNWRLWRRHFNAMLEFASSSMEKPR